MAANCRQHLQLQSIFPWFSSTIPSRQNILLLSSTITNPSTTSSAWLLPLALPYLRKPPFLPNHIHQSSQINHRLTHSQPITTTVTITMPGFPNPCLLCTQDFNHAWAVLSAFTTNPATKAVPPSVSFFPYLQTQLTIQAILSI